MVYKSAYKCTVISFKMLLEMVPLIYYYYNYYFGFVFDLYKYIFCIKKEYCDVTSQCKNLLQGNTANLIPIDGLSISNTVRIFLHAQCGG